MMELQTLPCRNSSDTYLVAGDAPPPWAPPWHSTCTVISTKGEVAMVGVQCLTDKAPF